MSIGKLARNRLQTTRNIIQKSMLAFFEQDANSIFYDPALQRRSVWKILNKNSYLNSVLSYFDVPLNPIWLADIESCMKYCLENYKTEDSEYFRKLLNQGFKYLSLDGQNRTKTIEELFRNELPVYSVNRQSKLYGIDGVPVTIDRSRGKTFDTLGQPLQAALEQKKIDIGIVYGTDFETLGLYFRMLNDGVPLNSMEKRNSIPTPFGAFITKMAEKYPNTYSHLKENKISRMADLEHLAESYLATHPVHKHKVDSDDAGLDRLYNFVYNLDKEDPYPEADLSRFEKICEMVNVAGEHSLRGLDKRAMRLLMAACGFLLDQGYELIDSEAGKGFAKWVCESKKALLNRVEVLKGQEQLVAEQSGTDAPPASDYFTHWSGNYQIASSRKKALNAWIHGGSIQRGAKSCVREHTVKYALENGLLDEFIQRVYPE